jgi:hypothetical protein
MNCILGELYEIWSDTEQLNYAMGELQKLWDDTCKREILVIQQN